ncbi:hypothetical protein Nepgr_030371 [Nepenthes gracilis]|uniref:Uncharacterized protein n=1 Tax=Nepenthes gracilis TaxID=150966 RepID=A0AAD3Y449_NEPGR|nr:hypothetical protein Nepgr_030371 [Nepenthes gracilis]
MADTSTRRRQPSRLQRRAPASIQVNRSEWNVAIPLLSPLASSPPPNRLFDQTAEMESRQGHHQLPSGSEQKPAPFKKWQHPAAPFFYEPAPLASFARVDKS